MVVRRAALAASTDHAQAKFSSLAWSTFRVLGHVLVVPGIRTGECCFRGVRDRRTGEANGALGWGSAHSAMGMAEGQTNPRALSDPVDVIRFII